MYGSGLRVSEICTIPVNAFDPDEGFARVFGKEQKGVWFPLVVSRSKPSEIICMAVALFNQRRNRRKLF